jgi:hypothetical protein
MHPVALQHSAGQPWTAATIGLALSLVLMIMLLMLGGEAFVPHR